MRAIFCSFSALDDLRPRDRKDKLVVLATLARVGRFSVFEATQYKSLANTLDAIFEAKWLERTGGEYPWTEVRVTPAGEAELARWRAGQGARS